MGRNQKNDSISVKQDDGIIRSRLYRAKVSDFAPQFFLGAPNYKKHKSEEIFEKY